jgi:D-beta-D-heptose 7-phosphate kinase/D-beta-D-heptose 1-phosphate adenosyltransferase
LLTVYFVKGLYRPPEGPAEVRRKMSDIPIGRLSEILDRIRAVKVMVIGDVMLDKYVWGSVSRISPEAPVPVVDIKEETTRLGGAANVANNIVALGASCSVFGVTGDDTDGAGLRHEVESRGIDASGMAALDTRPTTIKTRVIAHNQQVVRTDRESREELAGDEEKSMIDSIIGRLGEFQGAIISDYGKGVITRSLLDALIPDARSRDIVLSVDPKETHFLNYRNVSLITPNVYEAGSALGKRIFDEGSLLEVGWELLDTLKPDALLITRGENGMSLFEAGRSHTHFPTVSRQVYDVTGAGDTVITSFTLALCAGASMSEAAHIANHSAGIVIRDVGTGTVEPAELIASFETHSSDT